MNLPLQKYALLLAFVLGLSVLSGCSEEKRGPVSDEPGKTRKTVGRPAEGEKKQAPQDEPEKDRLAAIREGGRIVVLTRNNANCFYIYRGEFMGFEYDLAKAFADQLGVELQVETPDWQDMIEMLNKGKGDFIAANVTVSPVWTEHVDFSEGYLSIEQRVILHKDNHTVRGLEDLEKKTIHIRRNTSYEERLFELREEGLDVRIRRHYDTPTEELIRRVASERIEMTIADSNIALLNRRYYPDIKMGFAIEDPQPVAWAVRKGEQALVAEMNTFFRTIKTNGIFDDIHTSYYGNVEPFDRFDVRKFHERLQTRLPKFESIIKKAAIKYGFDWRFIAAIVYQESQFDPEARSHRGAEGLMQLTNTTAKELGVTDRMDPKQSIMGGVKYLAKLYRRYDRTEGLDRLLIALASYNVGPRHVANAQKIARKKGLDPHKWSSLEETLPLLCYEEYVEGDKFGYCRGMEPVQYVNRILHYFDILKGKAITRTARVRLHSHRPNLLTSSLRRSWGTEITS